MKTISRYIMTLALLLTAVGGAWAQDPNAVTAAEINSVVYSGWSSIDGKFFKASELPGFQAVTENQAKSWAGVPSTGEVMLYYEFVADGNVKGVHFKNGVYDSSFEETDLTCYLIWEDINYQGDKKYFYTTGPAPSGPEVTLNDDKSEASFQMPQYDATATYTIKRDMSVDMPVTVQDAEQNSRFRVKKQGDTFVPADMNMEQIVALFTVHDDIEEKNLTANTDFTVQFFAVNEEGQKTGEAIPFNDFTFAPGNYVATAVAASNSNYSGETALSNVFTLFQGYEVTVGAGEYATFYKDENLYTEDENAELYTIASVTESEAVLSDAITVAPANTPLLVYNKSEESKTFLLIPTTDDADEVTPATQFVGTLEATTIPASATGADNYALNGYAFVWVKTAIEVGANKCWLHIASQPAAARAMTRSIVGGNGTTGIDAIENVTIDNEGWYDMQGRKLQAKPNRGGIYIHNGKKVVVR